jgi:branched-chain amino acid transport system ATP-binding protein
MTTSSAPALRLTDVGIGFLGVRALDRVTFDIPRGGVSAVIGPNGAGKTTLFNCVSGIYRHEGSIALDGDVLDGMRAFRRSDAGIARTFQTPLLLDADDVLTNVMLGSYTRTRAGLFTPLWAPPRARREERTAREWALEIIERVGLGALASIPAGALAHGDRRRVEIARALIARPRLLMLDEPAAGLSEQEANSLMDLVVAHGEETGMTCVLVEHDVALVMRYATTIAVLDAGRLLAVGGPDEIQKNPAVVAAYLGSDVEVEAA